VSLGFAWTPFVKWNLKNLKIPPYSASIADCLITAITSVVVASSARPAAKNSAKHQTLFASTVKSALLVAKRTISVLVAKDADPCSLDRAFARSAEIALTAVS